MKTQEALLLSPAEAAKALGIGRTTVYALLSSGALPSVTIGRCRRVPLTAVRRLAGLPAEPPAVVHSPDDRPLIR